MPRMRKLRAMATALGLMEHLPVSNYGECQVILKRVRFVLNEYYGALWGARLPVGPLDFTPLNFETAASRLEYVAELIRYMPVNSYRDTLDLIEAIESALEQTIGQLMQDAHQQPFRLPPRIATDNGERILPFLEECGAEGTNDNDGLDGECMHG